MLLLILVSYPTDIFKKKKVIILNDLHILTLIDSLVETDRTLLIFKLKEILSPCDRYLESNPMLSWTQSVQQKSQAAQSILSNSESRPHKQCTWYHLGWKGPFRSPSQTINLMLCPLRLKMPTQKPVKYWESSFFESEAFLNIFKTKSDYCHYLQGWKNRYVI